MTTSNAALIAQTIDRGGRPDPAKPLTAEQREMIQAARDTLAPIADQDWHGKWRIQSAIRLLEKLETKLNLTPKE